MKSYCISLCLEFNMNGVLIQEEHTKTDTYTQRKQSEQHVKMGADV